MRGVFAGLAMGQPHPELVIITLRASLRNQAASARAATLEVRKVRRYGRHAVRKFREIPRDSTTSRTSRQVRRIYKICSASAWREAERQGVYRGSADDLRDGFIHFSTAQQLAATAARHFAGQKGLFLVAVDADALGEALRWEPARDGALFPHRYGDLDL